MFYLIDGMAYVRRELERHDRAPRKILNEMLSMQPGDIAMWCWEGKGARKTRQNLYPAYKSRRAPHPDEIWPLIDLLKVTLQHTASIQFSVPGFEADDVIATLVRKYPTVKKHIRTVDGDLAALCDDNTTCEARGKVHPRWLRLYKTCVGDLSDCISGIPGFGQKSWESLSEAKELENLERLIFAILNDPDAVRETPPWEDIAGAANALTFMRPAVSKWLLDPANYREVKALWTVVGLLNIPDDLLGSNMVSGKPNPEAADAVLREFRH